MGDTLYPQILRAVMDTPWVIHPDKLAAIRDLVMLRASGARLTRDEIVARIGADAVPRRDAVRVGSAAVIPIHGVLTPRADLMSDMSGGTPVDRLRRGFAAAVNDPDVSSVVLDVDSPGGQTDLIPEFAADIRSARGRKPIVAVANTVAASGAYWIASQADEVVATPSASVGSIGVFTAHTDRSAQQEMDGVRTTLVSAGEYKTETSPFEPLSDKARAYLQDRVDELYGMFVGDIARGRGVSDATVRDGYGGGRMLSAARAHAAGMIDGVETMESVLGRVAVDGAVASGGITGRAHADARFAGTVTTSTSNTIGTSDTSSTLRVVSPTLTARLRASHRDLVACLDAARGLADVRERDHLTTAKREQFAAVLEALGVLDGVRADIARLLDETDPDRARRDYAAAAAAYHARRIQERTI